MLSRRRTEEACPIESETSPGARNDVAVELEVEVVDRQRVGDQESHQRNGRGQSPEEDSASPLAPIVRQRACACFRMGQEFDHSSSTPSPDARSPDACFLRSAKSGGPRPLWTQRHPIPPAWFACQYSKVTEFATNILGGPRGVCTASTSGREALNASELLDACQPRLRVGPLQVGVEQVRRLSGAGERQSEVQSCPTRIATRDATASHSAALNAFGARYTAGPAVDPVHLRVGCLVA